MKNKTFYSVLNFFLIITLLFFLIACASNKSNNTDSNQNSESKEVEKTIVSVLPAIPKKTSYFDFIDEQALASAQMGSPKYIQDALQRIKKTVNEYSEEEEVLLAILDTIMTTVWTSENVIFQPPATLPENVYVGIISYVKNGMFDANAGDSDFFTLVLPCLAIATSSQNSFYPEAQISLNKAFKINSDSVLLNYLQGLLYSKQSQYSLALPYLQKAYSSESDCIEIAMLYLQTMFECKQFESAYNIATKMENADDSNSQLLKLCAQLALNLNKLDEADSYVGRLLQQDSNNTENILLRAKILFLKQDYLKTSSLLDAYAKSSKPSLDYLLLRSALQQQWNKNTSAAISTISEALHLFPSNEEVLLFAAELAVETGSTIDGKNAFELINNLTENDSNKIRLLQIQIAEYKRQKNWQQAYTKLSELLKVQNNLETNLDLVNVCLEIGMNTKAMDIIAPLYYEDSTNEDIQMVYIKSLVANNKQTEAKNLIERLLKTASSKTKSFLYYQRSVFATNDDSKLSDLRSCLTANPRNQDALFALYELYFSKNDYRKAQYYLKQAIALNPNDESLLLLNSQLERFLQ